MQSQIRSEFLLAQQVLQDFLKQDSVYENMEKIADCLITAIKNGNKIIACGNGGSMTDAMHFAEELCGKFRHERRALPAIAISDPAFISCVANDFGYDYVFARFVEGMGNSGDVLLVISTSGNSENVLQAVEIAKLKGMTVVALTGKTGGELLKQTNLGICVPHTGYADRIQEIHIKIIHTLIHVIEHELIEK